MVLPSLITELITEALAKEALANDRFELGEMTKDNCLRRLIGLALNNAFIVVLLANKLANKLFMFSLSNYKLQTHGKITDEFTKLMFGGVYWGVSK